MEPILKWAGGKRKLLPEIEKIIKSEDLKGNRFYEPFIGGGSVAFYYEHSDTVINDINEELINVYKQIRDNPKKLIKELKNHQKKHNREYYYKIRNMDRDSKYSKLSDIKRAARIIYLNKTCYNGLYRVNSKGYFNVPCGRYVNPDIVSEERINKINSFLTKNNVEIRNGDFSECVKDAKSNDVLYFDPPYDYEGSGFISYSSNGFSRDDLERLKKTCDELITKGCKVLISNNDTKFVNELFNDKHYIIKHIEANRFISCDGQKRKKVKEVLIYGKQ